MIEKIKKILNSNYSDEVILATTLGNLILIFFADGFIVAIDTENYRLTRLNVHRINFRDYLPPYDYSDTIIAEYEKMNEIQQLLIYISLRFEHNSESLNHNHVVASYDEILEAGKGKGKEKGKEKEEKSDNSTPESIFLQGENLKEAKMRAEIYDKKIQKVVNSLTPLQTKVFIGKMCEDKTEMEIAKELGKSRSTIQSHWNAILKKFKDEFPDFP